MYEAGTCIMFLKGSRVLWYPQMSGSSANTFLLVEGQHHQWHLLDFITCCISEKKLPSGGQDVLDLGVDERGLKAVFLRQIYFFCANLYFSLVSGI